MFNTYINLRYGPRPKEWGDSAWFHRVNIIGHDHPGNVSVFTLRRSLWLLMEGVFYWKPAADKQLNFYGQLYN